MSAREIGHSSNSSLLATFWNGVPCIVRCHDLSPEFLRLLGGFKPLDQAAIQTALVSLTELRTYATQAAKILRIFLDYPSYDQLFALIGHPSMARGAEARFREIEELIQTMPNGPERQEYEFETAKARILFDLVFPADFIVPLVMYAAGIEREVVNEATVGMLLNMAKSAEAEGGNPSDFLPGPFTPFIHEDLDRKAWMLLAESRAQKNSREK
jgi:hypothetical protein